MQWMNLYVIPRVYWRQNIGLVMCMKYEQPGEPQHNVFATIESSKVTMKCDFRGWFISALSKFMTCFTNFIFSSYLSILFFTWMKMFLNGVPWSGIDPVRDNGRTKVIHPIFVSSKNKQKQKYFTQNTLWSWHKNRKDFLSAPGSHKDTGHRRCWVNHGNHPLLLGTPSISFSAR